MPTLVEVRPIVNEKKWHGKEGKESFTQPKTIEVLYNPETGKYNTGLTEEEAQKYGKMMGVNLSDQFNPEDSNSYWSTKAGSIKLQNHTMIFDIEKANDFVKVKNLKASKFVANSLKELEDGAYPDATHVIFDEEEEVSNKVVKIQNRNEAVLISEKMSLEDKISMVQILSKKSVKGRSPDFIAVEIADIIEKKAPEFLKFAKMGREEVRVRAQVIEMAAKNILTKEQGSYYYMGELIGMDYEDAVAWFKDPQNSKMKVSILEKLNK